MKIEKDKKLHFLAGAIIAVISGFLTVWFVPQFHPDWNTAFLLFPKMQYALAGIFCATVAGLLKEFAWDLYLSRSILVKNLWEKIFNRYLPNGFVDFKDALFTLYGGIAGGLFVWIIALSLNLGNTHPPVSDKQKLEDAYQKLLHVHDNDPASFSDSSLENRILLLKEQSDSLEKIIDKK